MTAFSLLLLLSAGAAGYISWAQHRIAHGDPAWWFVAGVPVAYLAPVLFLASLWFTLSWIWRTPRPPEDRLGPGACARWFVGEVRAVAWSWPLMILHRWLIVDPMARHARAPLLLIHGVAVNDGVWVAMRRRLARRGLGPIYTINYGPPLAGIEHFAGQLNTRIDAICVATGAAQVTLIAHSMGGLVARAYLRHFGAARVARLVTIGTPHHGSVLAWTFIGRCLAQMRPGNPWLAALNGAEGDAAPVPITSIWSRHDSMVAPQSSAELACAQNVAVVGIGHNALLSHRGVIDQVARAIADAGPDGETGPARRRRAARWLSPSGNGRLPPAIARRIGVQAPSGVTTFLFTDIEGSTRLWDQEHDRMRIALARHDAIARAAVEDNHGVVVKMSGDGTHAAFDDPRDALVAALQLQQALAEPGATHAIPLLVRCGLHAGVTERRDGDFFGTAVNRAARIMSVAHGGQTLVSEAVAALVGERLPPGVMLRDLGTVRLRGLTSTERVFQLVHPRLRQDFPSLRSLESTPNNLPQQLTSFIGRGRESADIKSLLAKTRLLTLIGVGGIGKTRLSLQVAADVMAEYPDGMWLVELAPLTDARLVAQAVASVLGVIEEAGHPVVEALMKYVKDRNLLLILDNCEHLVDACADLAKQLLQAAPNLRILASSREHLRVAGETTYPVPALAAPDPYDKFIHTTLTQFEAARLFIDRAVAAQPAFAISEQNAAAIADVCHRLDGIPLAIELAASRVRALPVGMIAARLNDRFRLLGGSDRTVLPRQRTLRALIDWSYDLLTEPERALFRRLAVFAGGWTLEAAEAIGANGDIREGDILDLLSSLVEKSLLALDGEAMRYRFLDTVHQYAKERLGESGEEPRVRSRHLAYYLALAEEARPELFGRMQSDWLARLDRERENLLSAHAWCDRAEGGAEAGVRLVYAMKPYCFNRGLLGLGHRLTLEALGRAGAQARSLARCKVLADAGQYSSFMGRYDEAQQHLLESLAIAREISNAGMVARVLQPLGMAYLGQEDVGAARRYLEEAFALARDLGDKREIAGAANALAQLHRIQADLETAEPLYNQVVSLARELGDREITAVGLLNLAMVSLGRGNRERARSMLLEVLAIAEEIGSRPAGQSALEVCAALATMRKEWTSAARFYGSAEAQKEDTGIQRDPTDDAFLQPLVARARATLGTAAFATAEDAGRALPYGEAITKARSWLEECGP